MSGDADLVIRGGRVFAAFGPRDLAPYGSELGPRPIASPTALAVRGGRIAWVGRDDEAGRDWTGPRTTVVDARGGLISAGFDDAHLHIFGSVDELDDVDLEPLDDLSQVQAAIARQAAANPGAPWVRARGWQYGQFPGGVPTRAWFDAVVPDRPGWAAAFDGHTGWVNSAGLRAAGIDRDTPDPVGGEIVRDPTTGEPTGVLKEAAADLVWAVLPPPTREWRLDRARRTFAAMLASGLTAIQDAHVDLEELELWQALRAEGAIPLRARVALSMEPPASVDAWLTTLDAYEAAVADLRGGPWLDVGILKAFADGVVETRTAALLAPYADAETTGTSFWEPGLLDACVAEADRRGWQVETHAIGDRGVRMALDAHERAAAVAGEPGRDRRHRVEHIETVDRDDIPRFAALGVVASMQPYHANPIANQVDVWAGNLGPDRAGRGWAWGSLWRAGAELALGSDWSVVTFDPFVALHAAVNRQTLDGHPPGGWIPSEKLSLPDALSAYTRGSAVAAFAEGRRGRVAPGFDADLVVLDRDILAEGPSAILGTSVALTVVDGRIVHQSEAIG